MLIRFLFLAALIVFGFLFIFSLYTFYISIRPARIFSNVTPEGLGIPYEKIKFSSADGVPLAGWFIPKLASPSDQLIILMHGYPADKGDIFPAFLFLRHRYNLFFFDFRHHGESGGFYTGIGGKEVNDLLGAVEFVKSRGMKKIGLFGFSMGGAVALMSLDKIPELRAVISESSYARLDWMALELYRPTFFLKYPLLTLTRFWSRIFLATDPAAVSPVDKVRGSQVPILLMHSETDEMIPFSHALKLQEALRDNPHAQFAFRGDARHGMMDPEYQKTIEDFFRKHLH